MADALRAEQALQRARTLHQLGRLDEARPWYAEALQAAPAHAQALHLAGVLELQSNRPERAVDMLTSAVRAEPRSSRAQMHLGSALHGVRRFEAAVASYDAAIALDPGNADAFYNRALALTELRQFEAALGSYRQALRLRPDYVAACNNSALVLAELGRHDEALAACDQALALDAGHAEPHLNRGNALRRLGRVEAALASYEAAIARRPDWAEAQHNRGLALADLGRDEAALAGFVRALELEPRYAEAHLNCGNMHYRQRRWQEALRSYRQALEIRPDYAEAYLNLGAVLSELRLFEGAVASFDQAGALGADLSGLHAIRLYSRMQLADWRQYGEELARIVASVGSDAAPENPFCLLALSDSPQSQLEAAGAWTRRHCPANPELGPLVVRETGGKLKIGYFSANFQTHPVAALTAELFELHDRSRFEIQAFSFGPDAPDDPMRQRLKGAFDRFFDLRGATDHEAALLARRMEIDIAVDLGGFTNDSRSPRIFARRVAPVQLGYLGYLGTMAAGYMDYLITDATIVSPESRDCYAENLIYLPSYQVNDSRRPTPELALDREALGLPRDAFVYCCFNATYKITPPMFDVWMRILRRVDRSVLFLLAENETSRQNLRLEAAARGIEPDRLVFGGRLDAQRYLARYRAADLFLDTLPYNAGTTASDALWVGLPVLTCRGRTFAGRVAASLLTAIGLTELVTETPADYEELAVALGSERERVARLRLKLAANRLTTALFDTRAFTRHLEAAYAKVFAIHRAGEPCRDVIVGREDAERHAATDDADVRREQANEQLDRGIAAAALGHHAAALGSFRRALSIDPARAESHRLCAQALLALGDREGAVASYDRAAALQGADPALWNDRGNVLAELGRRDEALASYDRALALDPKFVAARVNRGNLRRAKGALAAARADYERAVALAPDAADVHAGLGAVLTDCGELSSALASYDRALELDPAHAAAHCNRGYTLLLQGNFAAGWPELEWRWRNEAGSSLHEARPLREPLWLGAPPLAGYSIFVHAEQGYGDTLQFCRYVPQLAALGARVIFEPQAGLARLLEPLAGVWRLHEPGAAREPCDFHCPLMSLPLALAASAPDIPTPAGYLRAPSDQVAYWRARLGPGSVPRVGLAWSGNPRHPRSAEKRIALALLLAQLPAGPEYFCLQTDLRAEDAEVLAANPGVRHFPDELAFDSAAALCECMDLVISIDTSIAHLAAALGRPTWILLPSIPDWRWQLDREDSPWYATAKLFRQARPGEWQEVLARVRAQLAAIALAPETAGLWLQAGMLDCAHGRAQRGLERLEQAARLEVDSVEAAEAARRVCASAGLFERGLEYGERVLRWAPNEQVALAHGLLLPCIQASRASIRASRERFAATLADALASDRPLPLPESVTGASAFAVPSQPTFYLAYHGENDRELQTGLARVYAKRTPELAMTAAHCERPQPRGRRLRIGFISRYFRKHSIAMTSRGLIAKLSREHFEVHVLRITPSAEDEVTAAIRASADHTIDLPAGFHAARNRIAALELDILFYQDIGMEPMSYFLAFARLARVQCVSFGHPDTTGIENMDYFISNDLFEPENAREHYSESLVLLRDLPTLAYYYRPPRPARRAPRERYGLESGQTLYLCPQTLFKVHPDFDALVAGVLARDPKGIVLFIEGAFTEPGERLRDRLRAHIGQASDRIRFVPRMSYVDFLELLAAADVILDTVHFNGMNTSLEAFSVGTPVVTLPGRLQRGRHTQAMYRKMAIDDCVAVDSESYVEIATRIGRERDYARELRARLLARSEVLFEDPRVVSEFERFFVSSLVHRGGLV